MDMGVLEGCDNLFPGYLKVNSRPPREWQCMGPTYADGEHGYYKIYEQMGLY